MRRTGRRPRTFHAPTCGRPTAGWFRSARWFAPRPTPPTITHYNLFRSIEIDGQPRPGVSSDDAIAAMERQAREHLPPGTRFAWTRLTLDQIEGGSAAALIFGLGIFVVFLVLAAQYESFLDPIGG
jgi:HAE1 family hydrophobic/amphiphilic exporter-1